MIIECLQQAASYDDVHITTYICWYVCMSSPLSVANEVSAASLTADIWSSRCTGAALQSWKYSYSSFASTTTAYVIRNIGHRAEDKPVSTRHESEEEHLSQRGCSCLMTLSLPCTSFRLASSLRSNTGTSTKSASCTSTMTQAWSSLGHGPTMPAERGRGLRQSTRLLSYARLMLDCSRQTYSSDCCAFHNAHSNWSEGHCSRR